MGYIKNNLAPNENIIYETNLHWKIFIPSSIFFLLAVLLCWKGDFVFWNVWAVFACLSLAFGIYYLVKAFLRYSTEEYAVTTNTVILKKGLFENRAKIIPLKDIEGIDIISPIGGRILGYGTLSYGSGSATQEFKDISSPNAFWNKARQQLNNPQLEIEDTQIKPPKDIFAKIQNTIAKIPGPKKTAEIIIDSPVDIVWNVITDIKNFNVIMTGFWNWHQQFDRNNVTTGTTFKRGHVDYYIVHWKPNFQFSIGHNLNSWDYDFRLTEFEGKTKVKYTRQFNILGFLLPSQTDVESTVNNFKNCADLALKSNMKELG